MSAFHGPQAAEPGYARLPRNKGALAKHRADKRIDAELRDQDTPPERRSTKRRPESRHARREHSS